VQLRNLAVFHLDPYTQALSKLERGHVRDREDVPALVRTGVVDPAKLPPVIDPNRGSAA
jgi:hypothetical protein